MKKLWDSKNVFSNLELEGQGRVIIMGVTRLLLLGTFYSIQTNFLYFFAHDYSVKCQICIDFQNLEGVVQHLIEKEICETSQMFNSIRQRFEKMEIEIVWMSWNFVRFQKKFQTDAENFILSCKTKKIIPKKIHT